MISGNERIGIAELENQIPSEEYSEENDVMFFKTEYDLISLKEKMFAIFFPHDIHMPGIIFDKEEEVKKVVMKIKVDL